MPDPANLVSGESPISILDGRARPQTNALLAQDGEAMSDAGAAATPVSTFGCPGVERCSISEEQFRYCRHIFTIGRRASLVPCGDKRIPVVLLS